MNEDGTMAKGEQLKHFAILHNLPIGRIDDLISYRLKKEKLIKFKKKLIYTLIKLNIKSTCSKIY